MFKEFILGLEEYLRSHRIHFLIMMCFFLGGVTLGVVGFYNLTEEHIRELTQFVQGFLELSVKTNIEQIELLKVSFAQNMKLILLLWGLGVSIIGIPCIYLLILFRGFISGFGASVLLILAKGSGGAYMAMGLFFKDVLLIPPVLAIAVNGINFSRKIIQRHSGKQLTGQSLKQSLLFYCVLTVFFTLLTFIGVLFEGYGLPIIVNYAVHHKD